MDGVFWYNDMGFVVDIHKMPSSFPGGIKFGPVVLDDMLRKAAGFPNLGRAPVASWIIARLFHLTNERLGFETTAKIHADGGGFYLNLIAFSRDFKPLAFFYVHGTSVNCSCWGQCSRQHEPANLISSFINSLVTEPLDLMKCCLTTIDTDPPDLDKRRFCKPYTLGWNGKDFLGAEMLTN
jgi:hypothetical protein